MTNLVHTTIIIVIIIIVIEDFDFVKEEFGVLWGGVQVIFSLDSLYSIHMDADADADADADGRIMTRRTGAVNGSKEHHVG